MGIFVRYIYGVRVWAGLVQGVVDTSYQRVGAGKQGGLQGIAAALTGGGANKTRC